MAYQQVATLEVIIYKTFFCDERFVVNVMEAYKRLVGGRNTYRYRAKAPALRRKSQRDHMNTIALVQLSLLTVGAASALGASPLLSSYFNSMSGCH